MFCLNITRGKRDQPSVLCTIIASAKRSINILASTASLHFATSPETPPSPIQATIGTPMTGKPKNSSPRLHAALRIIVKLFKVSRRPSLGKVPGSNTRSSTPYSIKVFAKDLRRSKSFGARTVSGQLYIRASSAISFQLSFVAA